MNKHELAAKRLAELGHTTRLCIFRQLVKAGDKGLPVGHIQKKLDVPSSTLSHHLSRLKSVGLISQTRQGAVLICRADLEVMDEVACYIRAECGCD